MLSLPLRQNGTNMAVFMFSGNTLRTVGEEQCYGTDAFAAFS